MMRFIAPLLACLALSSCNVVSLDIAPGQVIGISGSGKYELELNLSAPGQDVYFVFTNPGGSARSLPEVSSDTVDVSSRGWLDTQRKVESSGPGYKEAQERADLELRQREALLPPIARGGAAARGDARSRSLPSAQEVGSSTLYYFYSFAIEGYSDSKIPCTLRGKRDASTAFGAKNLLVWVQDTAWNDPPGTEGPIVTQAMVDGLMDAFLKPDDTTNTHDNDIYDWVTAICGEEWGATNAMNLIGESDIISIVIYDIEGDKSTNGGIMGYFWSGNNFMSADAPSSNEAILFALDSYLAAQPDEGKAWSPDAYWFKASLSTLAHEFQHMISFYQRQVISGKPSLPTFVDEMLSEGIEDLVASRLLVPGPRDVDLLPANENGPVYDFGAGTVSTKTGRLQLLNLMLNETIATSNTLWSNHQDNARLLTNYAQAFGFSAWFLRNYGGPALYRSLYESDTTDINIVAAAARTLDPNLAREGFWDYAGRWGAAILLSDGFAPMPYSLNKGGAYSWVVNGSSVRAGSINHFSYSYEGTYGSTTGPSLVTTATIGAVELKPYSNTYYLAGKGLSSKHRWTINNMDGVIINIVSK